MTTELQFINCNICGQSKSELVRMLNGYHIVRCLDCSFHYVNPRPPEEAILAAYTAESKDGTLSFADGYESTESVDNFYSWTGEYILNRLQKIVSKGTLLDIGAGQGWAVKQALKKGYDAFGYEFGDGRAFNSDIEIKNRIFSNESDLKAHKTQYDILCLSAVLEHVYKPKDFLKHWFQYLKPGGIFVISALPNLESLFIRLRLDGWDGNTPPGHLSYFTVNSIQKLLKDLDCAILDLFTMGAPVTFGLQNIFNQRKFDSSYWGDHSKKWEFTKSKKTQSLNFSRSPWKNCMTIWINHALKAMGCGSNIYCFLKKSEKSNSKLAA